MTSGRRGFMAPCWAAAIWLPVAAGALSPTLSSGRLEAGKELFERHCGTCHGLQLPASQKLHRTSWEWVVEDMVGHGMTWLSPAQRELIVDYLAAEHGLP